MADTTFEQKGTDPTKPMDADKTLGELLSRLTGDFGDLVSTQVELAKVGMPQSGRPTP